MPLVERSSVCGFADDLGDISVVNPGVFVSTDAYNTVYVPCGMGAVRVREYVMTVLLTADECGLSTYITDIPGTPYVVVTCRKSGVLRVDTSSDTGNYTHTVIATLKQCAWPNGVVVVPGTHDVVVGCGGGSGGGVIRIGDSPSSGITVTVIATAQQCFAVTVAADAGHTVWVACGGEYGGMIRIDGTSGVITTIDTTDRCPMPSAIVIIDPSSPNSDILVTCFVQTGSGGVVRISGGGGGGNYSHITNFLAVDQCVGPVSIAVAPLPESFVIVSCLDDGIVIQVTTTDNNTVVSAVDTLHACHSPFGVAVVPNSLRVLIICQGDGRVVQISRQIVDDLYSAMAGNLMPVPGTDSDVVVATGIGVYRTRQPHAPFAVADVTVVATSTQCPSPGGVWATGAAGGDMIIIACAYTGVIAVRGTVITTLANATQCSMPSDVVMVGDDVVLATCEHRGVIAINIHAPHVVTNIVSAAQCVHSNILAVDTNGGAVVVTCVGDPDHNDTDTAASLVRIHANLSTVEVLATQAQCSAPADVAVDPSNGDVYAACFNSITRVTASRVVSHVDMHGMCVHPVSVGVTTGAGAGTPSTVYAACSSGLVSTTDGSVPVVVATPYQVGVVVSIAAVGVSDSVVVGGGGVSLVDPSCQGFPGYTVVNGECAPCPLGTARAANSLSARCIPCTPGRVAQPHLGAASCLPVPRGTYDSGLLPRIISFPCAPGQHSNVTGATVCADCTPGFVSDASATDCTLCPAGKSSLAAAAACAQCSAGRYNHVEGGLCHDCTVGTVAPSPGASSCTPCPRPSFTRSSAQRQCDWCATGKYAVFRQNAPAQLDECRACPRGAQCPLQRNMTISSRYFAVTNEVTAAVRTYLCSGGRCGADGTCQPHRLPPDVNPLCGHCESKYSEWDGVCVSCTRARVFFIVFVVLFIWACVLVYHTVSQSASGALRILMYFWQVAFLIVGRAVWIKWAQFINMDFMVGTTTASSSSSSSSRCLFPATPGALYVIRLVMPLCTFVLLGATALIHRAIVLWRRWRRRRQRHGHGLRSRVMVSVSVSVSGGGGDYGDSEDVVVVDDDDNDDGDGDDGGDVDDSDDDSTITTASKRRLWSLDDWSGGAYIRTTIALYLFTFNNIIQGCLEFLHCVHLDGQRYMFTEPAVNCNSHAYRATTPLVVVLLLLYIVIVPTTLLWYLCSFYHAHMLSAPPVRSYFGVVHEPFTDQWFWWGMLQMLRRAALVAVVVFFYDDALTRYGVLTLFNMVFQCMQLLAHPYNNTADNAWETLSLVALTVLSTLEGMEAPGVWAPLLTLTVGMALVARVTARRVWFVRRWVTNACCRRRRCRRVAHSLVGGGRGGGGGGGGSYVALIE